MKYPSGHESKRADPEFQKMIERKVNLYKAGCIIMNPGRILFSIRFEEHAHKFYHFKILPTDVFVASYPKTGTTWMQEIVWAMIHNPNLDHPHADQTVYIKAPMFELDATMKLDDHIPIMKERMTTHNKENFLETFELIPSPRVFKTHLHFKLHNPDALENAKFVYTIRNPMDTCLSYFHFARGMKFLGYPDSLDDFVQDFIDGNYQIGSYKEHLRQWWELRNHKNIHTIFYEDMKSNTMEEMKKLNSFLGTNLSGQQIENVIEYASFTEMKKRDPLKKSPELAAAYYNSADSQGFFRAGEIGTANKELSSESSAKIKKYFRENINEMQLPYDFSD